MTASRVSADGAGGGRDCGEELPDELVVNLVGIAEADAALAHVLVGQPIGEGLGDVGTHQVEGEVLLLAGEGDLGGTVAEVGGHAVGDRLGEAGQLGLAELAQPGQGGSAVAGDRGEVAVNVGCGRLCHNAAV